MALTIAYDLVSPSRVGMRGGLGLLSGTIAFDSAYPTGGEELDLTDYFDDLYLVLFENKSGLIFEYDYDNKKVLAYYPKAATTSTVTIAGTGGTADADNTLIKTGATTIAVAGTGTACTAPISGQGAAAADEVGNGADLSAITGVRFLAIGAVPM